MISIISFWDKILHFVSPMLLTAVGYGIAGFLLKKTKYADVSRGYFIIWVCICRALWRLLGILGIYLRFIRNMNLQRYNMSNGQPFIGRAALMDTMGIYLPIPLGPL